MKIEIREAKIENLKDIQNLNYKLFKEEYVNFDKTLNCDWMKGEKGTKYFKERVVKEDGCALIAVIDRIIVGYLVGVLADVKSYRNISKVAELENMYTLKEYRSLGVGTKLYQSFLSWCREKGVKRLKVTASAQNIQAINFYRKNGFKDYSLTLETNL